MRACSLGGEAYGAHVVQSIRQFDDQYPGIASRREDHVAHGLGLPDGTKLDLVKFGDTVDDIRDDLTEVLPEADQ